MTGCGYIDNYISELRAGRVPASREMLLACDLIERKLGAPGVFIDTERIEKARARIEKCFSMRLFPWELFVLALVHCYYGDDTLVFSKFLIMMGRGNGKNGFISGLAWYLTTPDHGVRGYNVDIIANSGDQAETSFNDVYEMLERHKEAFKKHYTWNRTKIICTKTESYIKRNTSNSRTKDGKRSACLIFDELHEYKNDDTIRVFRSGFGKREQSRMFEITTNGYVRGGVLDTELELAKSVLHGEAEALRLCPLIYKMDSDEEVHRRELWEKACPSLPYLQNLQIEMDQEYAEMAIDKSVELDFLTKRMNLPRSNMAIAVTEWDNIAATNRPLPDLTGWACTVGIDYASMRDWASVNFHFRRGDERYDISHSWVCTRNPELARVKAPWQSWGDVTPVDDVEIAPELLTRYVSEGAARYNVRMLACDNFRFALLRKALEGIGFDPTDRRNVKLVRPSDIMRVQPVVNSCFCRRQFTWGDVPSLRWAANNTCLLRAGKQYGVDTGNFYYGKIEGKSRKTDPFMALVASMTVEDQIPEALPADLADLLQVIM